MFIGAIGDERWTFKRENGKRGLSSDSAGSDTVIRTHYRWSTDQPPSSSRHIEVKRR